MKEKMMVQCFNQFLLSMKVKDGSKNEIFVQKPQKKSLSHREMLNAIVSPENKHELRLF